MTINRIGPLDREDPIRMAYDTAFYQAVISATTHQADMPVGAAVTAGEEIIGSGHADDIRTGDRTAHAEVQAIRDACIHSPRTPEAVISTLEPCKNCMAEIAATNGISKVYYGTPRIEAEELGLVRPYNKTAHDIAEEMGYPFEVVLLDDKEVRERGRVLLESASRDLSTDEVVVNPVTLLADVARLNLDYRQF